MFKALVSFNILYGHIYGEKIEFTIIIILLKIANIINIY